VPYGGAGPALQAVLAGTTQLATLNISNVTAQISAGAVRPLVQTGATRAPELPNSPTMIEAGFDGVVAETFQAMLAPAGTPQPVLQQLADAAVTAMRQEDVRKKLADVGFVVTGGGPDVLRARIDREVPMWKDVIEKTGIKVR
jgi:tripartite-type tricarboxylate transporter receptor subunit TctC